MSRPYRGESADEFYGITCPDDVQEPEIDYYAEDDCAREIERAMFPQPKEAE